MKEKNFFKQLLWSLLYMAVYFTWFEWLEKHASPDMRIIHVNADDYIPFCEFFIVPYLIWFIYIAGVMFYFLLKDGEDYRKCSVFLFSGMTIFLIISTFWPNGHHLRPHTLPRDNVFTQLIYGLWRVDTPTNLWPSIHVYNSLGVYFAIIRSRHFEKKPAIKAASFLLSASIIASTMLIKQHSVFDVMTAFLMAAVMYTLIYRRDLILNIRPAKQKKRVIS